MLQNVTQFIEKIKYIFQKLMYLFKVNAKSLAFIYWLLGCKLQ
jgi:hypothetical protein